MKNNEEIIRDVWFPEHSSNIEIINNDIQILHWKKADTFLYYVQYILQHGKLIVTGDVGDAIYNWGSDIDWDFLSGLDLGYFASKCVASENGRLYESWDTQLCEEVFKKELNEAKENFTAQEWHDLKKKHESELEDINANMSCEQEWYLFIYDNHTMLYDIFYSDYQYILAGIGKTIAIRCESHLLGLKMAKQKQQSAIR